MKLEESIAKKNPGALDKVYWLDIFAVNQHLSIVGDCTMCRQNNGAEWNTDVIASEPCQLCGKPKAFPCPPGAPGAAKPKPGEIACEVDKVHEVVQIVGRVLVSLDPELKTLTRLWVHTEIAEAVKT